MIMETSMNEKLSEARHKKVLTLKNNNVKNNGGCPAPNKTASVKVENSYPYEKMWDLNSELCCTYDYSSSRATPTALVVCRITRKATTYSIGYKRIFFFKRLVPMRAVKLFVIGALVVCLRLCWRGCFFFFFLWCCRVIGVASWRPMSFPSTLRDTNSNRKSGMWISEGHVGYCSIWRQSNSFIICVTGGVWTQNQHSSLPRYNVLYNTSTRCIQTARCILLKI